MFGKSVHGIETRVKMIGKNCKTIRIFLIFKNLKHGLQIEPMGALVGNRHHRKCALHLVMTEAVPISGSPAPVPVPKPESSGVTILGISAAD